MANKQKRYGLIGYPLGYSFSPEYFEKKFKVEKIDNYSYRSYPVKDLELLSKILPRSIEGFNVTIPYKEQILPYLDKLVGEAKSMKAVNCVKVVDGKWHGYNTDVYGFENSLKALIGRKKVVRALILGNGGAAKAVKYALRQMGISYKTISRKKGYRSYKNLDESIMKEHRLIVNTTPLGTYPDVKLAPMIPYQFLTDRHLLYDLVYNPQKSLFLKRGERKGAKIKNGLEMLHLQAERSWEIWNS